MNPAEIDPARLDAILVALGHWRLLAREITAEAAADQRSITLDLLQSARQLAAGVEALGRLDDQRRRSEAVLRNLEASAGHAARRVADRLDALRRVHDAAVRQCEHGTDATVRLEAGRVRDRAATEIERLGDAARQAERSSAELARLAERHRQAERDVAVLRHELGELRALTERGLTVMTSARRVLDDTADSYEQAQLSAGDLRRDLRSATPGPVFAPPAPRATVPPTSFAPPAPPTHGSPEPVVLEAPVSAAAEAPQLEQATV